MPRDMITALRIQGMRSIERIELNLQGPTVLIGDNGSGKSTLIEACELLRRVSSNRFFEEFHQIHGGFFSLLRSGASSIHLGVDVDGADERLRYDISLAKEGTNTVIASEQLDLGPYPGKDEPLHIIQRDRAGARVYQRGEDGRVRLQPFQVSPVELAISEVSGPFAPHPAITRMRRALASIEVHVPFEVTPNWVASAHGRRADPRSSLQLQPADRLERLATNLPNAYAALRSEFGETHWKETLDHIRLGLGNEIETVTLRAGGGGGVHSLWLKLKNLDDQIPPSGVAEGALAYLAFVALFRLPRPDRSLLAFDEPELHLHPELLMRVLDFFTAMSMDHPVLLATHSDRLLDGLEHPADQIKVCERDPKNNQTRLRTLDPEALRQWLDEYRGVGDVRSAGYLPSLLRQSNGSDVSPANIESSQQQS